MKYIAWKHIYVVISYFCCHTYWQQKRYKLWFVTFYYYHVLPQAIPHLPLWTHKWWSGLCPKRVTVSTVLMTSLNWRYWPVTRSFDVSLIYALINGWVNNREVGDLRLHRAHYDVTVMWCEFMAIKTIKTISWPSFKTADDMESLTTGISNISWLIAWNMFVFVWP